MAWPKDRHVVDLAKKQAGVVSYFQLAQSGFTKRQRHRRMVSGEWIRMLPGVARMYWSEETWLQRVWATVLWGGPEAVLDRRTAAALHGFAVEARGPIDILVRSAARRPAPWIRLHRLRRSTANEPDRTLLAGLPVVCAPTALIALAGEFSSSEFCRVVLAALRESVVTELQLRNALRRRRTFAGAAGAVALRRVVDSLSRSSADLRYVRG